LGEDIFCVLIDRRGHLVKWIVVLILLLWTRLLAMGQGQLVFNNRVNNVVQAPVYGVEPLRPDLFKHGNTAEGFPAGSQTYNGLPLAGTGFTAQLFGGSTRAPLALLQPLIPAAVFRSGDAAGFVVPPNVAVSIPGVTEGERARVQLRVWENRGGAVTNWDQVIADSAIAHGESISVVTPPLGGLFRPPPNLVGLESFNLATGALQTVQSIRINFQPASEPAPQNYLIDGGLVFGPREGGLSYGWSEDMQNAAWQRHSAPSPDQRHDTFIAMANSTWELAVPDGVYGVHLAAGDPDTLVGVYRLEVESVPIVEGTPVFDQYWVEGQALVAVNDGRLTLRSWDGSLSNRVCFIDLVRVEAPILHAQQMTTADFRIAFRGDPGVRYDIESSGDLMSWVNHSRAEDHGQGEFVAEEAATALQRLFRAHIAVSTPPRVIFACDFESGVSEQWLPQQLAVAPHRAQVPGTLRRHQCCACPIESAGPFASDIEF
jgi:hypothetical protein